MNVFLSLILLCIAIIHNGLFIEYFDEFTEAFILGLLLGIPLSLVMLRWVGNSYIALLHYIIYFILTGWIMGAIM